MNRYNNVRDSGSVISVLRAPGSVPAATRDNAQAVEERSTASWYSPNYAGDPNQAPTEIHQTLLESMSLFKASLYKI